jgi:glucosamine--fructose-6-phosphate aminotransferase (isomerizing)
MILSQMEQEARSAPEVIALQYTENLSALQDLCARLKNSPPPFAMTIARGSSDHAATFAKYLLETQLGWVTASAAPSVETLYGAKLKVRNSLVMGLSQSGESPDIAEMLHTARQHGAITVAIVNQHPSPLSRAAEYVIPIHAGPEKSVAATKSYLGMLGALVQFVALMTEQPALTGALTKLPQTLEKACEMNWSAALEEYREHKSTFVVARGFGFPVAQEAALKFKETARIHAEAFSGAEVLHGPFALIQQNFPLMLLGQKDVSLPGILDLGQRAKQLGARVLLALPADAADPKQILESSAALLPLPNSLHPICDPLMAIQAFYIMMAKLANVRGLDPDKPANLTKVTKTW